MNRFIKDRKKTDWYKIIARAIGFLVCAFFLTFIVGEGIPDIIKGKGDELIPFLPFVLLPIAGFIVAWVRPLAGALMMITGSLILLAYLIMGGNIKAALI